jgi:hypothetical protein
VLPAGAVVSRLAPIPGQARAGSVSTENASPSTVAGPGELRVVVEQLDALSLQASSPRLTKRLGPAMSSCGIG